MSGLGRAVVVAGSVALLVGCAGPPAVDVAAEAKAVRERSEQWNAAVIAKDLDAIMRFYAPEAVQMPANAPLAVGQEAIRAWYETWLLEPSAEDSFACDVVEVAASGDMAYERGTYRFAMATPAGRFEDVGKYLTIWKKVDGQWRAAVDTANSDQPLPGS